MRYLIAIPLLCLALTARAETETLPCDSDLFTGRQLKEGEYISLDVDHDHSRDVDIILEINQKATECISNRTSCTGKSGPADYSFSADGNGVVDGYKTTFIQDVRKSADGFRLYITETYFCKWNSKTQNGCRRTCNLAVDYPPGPDHD